MFSLKIRYALYGMILSASLITLVAQASSEAGVFGDYFYRMIGVCPTNKEIVTGFDPNTGQYGARVCTKITTILSKIGINVDDTTGNIGIGTTPSDTKKLTVQGDIDIVGTLKISAPVSYDDAVDRTTLDAGLITLCAGIGTWDLITRTCIVKKTYSWQIESYGACSATCGGTKTAVIVCQDNTGKTVGESECLGIKPTQTASCSADSCGKSYVCIGDIPTSNVTKSNDTDLTALTAWQTTDKDNKCYYTCTDGYTGHKCDIKSKVYTCTGPVPADDVVTKTNTTPLTVDTPWQDGDPDKKCYYKCTNGNTGTACDIPPTNKCTLPATLACELEL